MIETSSIALESSDRVPKHVAIVMDGNGRWAKSKGFGRLKGHIQGAQSLKRVIKSCLDLDIEYLTVFAFSTENWHRPQDEVKGLIDLLQTYLASNLKEIQKYNIRLRFIGDYHILEPKLVDLIKNTISESASNTKLNLTIAFNYGARDEITRAAKKIALQVQQGVLKVEEITEATFSKQLYTYDLPDPDLFIRTSEEFRISNFLLWQIAYTELIVVKTLWPDFTKDDLIEAVREFQKRDRRYGKISSQKE
ncbi:MAG: isoprenyl transferase [Janthinobacterium lividum]